MEFFTKIAAFNCQLFLKKDLSYLCDSVLYTPMIFFFSKISLLKVTSARKLYLYNITALRYNKYFFYSKEE